MEREAAGRLRLRRADSSVRSSALTSHDAALQDCNELAAGVQYNCNYMAARCCALIAAVSITAAAARAGGRMSTRLMPIWPLLHSRLRPALAAARGRHSFSF